MSLALVSSSWQKTPPLVLDTLMVVRAQSQSPHWGPVMLADSTALISVMLARFSINSSSFSPATGTEYCLSSLLLPKRKQPLTPPLTHSFALRPLNSLRPSITSFFRHQYSCSSKVCNYILVAGTPYLPGCLRLAAQGSATTTSGAYILLLTRG